MNENEPAARLPSWKPDELAAIAAASELQLTSRRHDGTLRRPVTIWVVRIGDALYVRSVRGSAGSWYRGSRERNEGRIEAGGVEREVDFLAADDDLDDAIDAAYREKYGYPSSAVDHITSPAARRPRSGSRRGERPLPGSDAGAQALSGNPLPTTTKAGGANP